MAKQISPLAPSVIPRLLPEFVEFWNEALADKPGLHEIPWSAEIRKLPPQPGGSDPLTVGSVQDIAIKNCTVRVFTPSGSAPEQGWPVMIYFHGGGWTLGGITTENVMASHLCKRVGLVVIAVDYRLAPENPYPAAADDAYDVFMWVYQEGSSQLNVDVSRLAVGGSSSGGNLAAIVTHHAAQHEPPIPITFSYLNVPVTDNTAPANPPPNGEPHPYPSWIENSDTASLTPAKMLWFREFYLPSSSPTHQADLVAWTSSPIFAPDELFARSPAHTFVGVCEIDILRDEGVVYAEKLKKFGANVELKVYKGAPHPVMAMDKRLKVGRECIDDAVFAAARAFGVTPTDP